MAGETLEDLTRLANRLEHADSGGRWIGAATNQHLFWVTAEGWFVPVKLLAHVLDGGQPDASRDQSKSATQKAITETLAAVGYQAVDVSHPTGETTYLAYIEYCKTLLPQSEWPRLIKRRRYFDQGTTTYWVKAKTATSIIREGEPVARMDHVPMPWSQPLEDLVLQSLKASHASRIARLKLAPDTAPEYQVSVRAWRRNPDVIAEALYRANGHCESCGNPAPFLRRNDLMPFLEVHHVIPLSEGGKDNLANVQALCPNCHRRQHFG